MAQRGDEPAGARAAHGPVRVLALIDHLVEGGAELLLSRFAAGAPTAGIELDVACLTDRWGNPAAAPLRAAGVEPVNLWAPERIGWGAVSTVRRHLRALRPDIVHTHLGSSDVIGGLAARSLGIPAVSTLHTPPWGGGRRDRVRNRITVAVRRRACARVIAVSEAARADYLERGWDRPEHVVTIHNGYDVRTEPGAGAAIRRELDIPADAPVLGMVSALRPIKGHLIALEAQALLRERFPDLHLVIVGHGTEREAIEARAQALGGQVRLTGSRSDVMALLDAFDVFVHPSFIEQFSGAVLEAMAASVPVVATAVGGNLEQLDAGRAGVLVPAPPEPRALAEGIAGLLADPERRRELAALARGRYEARFTTAPWVNRTRALYDEVLSAGARG